MENKVSLKADKLKQSLTYKGRDIEALIKQIESNDLNFDDFEKKIDNLNEANKIIKELEADIIKKPSKKRIAVNVAIWLPITLALSYLLFLMGEPRTVWMYNLIGIK